MKLIILILALSLNSVQAEPVILCDVSEGLNLINKDTYSSSQIERILNSCDKVSPNKLDVLLLHGLFARKNKQALVAISWFEKAAARAPNDPSVILELAATYEQVNQPIKAELLYQKILTQNPQNRAAILGLARVFRVQKEFTKATSLYQKLIVINPQDTEALNGFGWIKAAQNDLTAAKDFFNKALKIQPQNLESINALNQIAQTELQKLGPANLCDANNGLILLNQEHPSFTHIKEILAHCAANKIENEGTRLLQGLLARKEAQNSKHYAQAIVLLEKAVKSAPPNDYNPELELAVTYEWAGKPQNALKIYQHVLSQDLTNRAAMFGQARTLKNLKKYDEAERIYQQLVSKNPKDVDAINGLGQIALAQNQLDKAIQLFKQSLNIQTSNKDAQIGLKESEAAKIHPKVVVLPSLCDADEGLILLNKENPPLDKIKAILARCDRNTPNTTSNLMLHGLLERHFAKMTQNYNSTLVWLTKAVRKAEPGNYTPILELAVTYVWAGNYRQALIVYQEILAKNPNNTAALLGKARVLAFSYHIKPAVAIYQQVLNRSPKNIEALEGLGEVYMANYQFKEARSTFNKALSLNPENKGLASDIKMLDESTKNILELVGGHYAVPPMTSDALNLYYFRNLNATDGLTVLATHNTRQIASGFGTGAALLPNNSLLLGYQHLIPNQYGWQVSYDARQHDGLPFEHRLYGSTNLFLQRNLEWFGGARFAFPDQWNTQLLISGINIYTTLPVNIRVTGFWAFQKIGGYNESYALDFSKEYTSHLFYDVGPSYLVQQKSWEVHGRLIFPVFKNQAFVAQVSHFMFNNSTFINAGWRVYWA